MSGGSSGLRGIFVQTLGVVSAGSPVHSSGLAAATATAPPVRMIPAPAALPTAEIVGRLNAAQPPILMGYAAKLAELAGEQRDGRLKLSLRSVISNSEALGPVERTAIGEAFGVPVTDLFVSTEGLVGHTEPGGAVFTFASDTCIAECVDDDGRPVPVGLPSAKVLLTHPRSATSAADPRAARPDDARRAVPNHSTGPPVRAGWGSIQIFPNGKWCPSWATGLPRLACRVLGRDPPGRRA